VPITVEVSDQGGGRMRIYAITDAQGCIDLHADLRLSAGGAADTESRVVHIQ